MAQDKKKESLFGNFKGFTPAQTSSGGFGNFSQKSLFSKNEDDPNKNTQGQVKKQQSKSLFGSNTFNTKSPTSNFPLFKESTNMADGNTPTNNFSFSFNKNEDSKQNLGPMGSLFDNSKKFPPFNNQPKFTPQGEPTNNIGSNIGFNPFVKSSSEQNAKDYKKESEKQENFDKKQLQENAETKKKQKQGEAKMQIKSSSLFNNQNISMFSPFTKKPGMVPLFGVPSKPESDKSSQLNLEKKVQEKSEMKSSENDKQGNNKDSSQEEKKDEKKVVGPGSSTFLSSPFLKNFGENNSKQPEKEQKFFEISKEQKQNPKEQEKQGNKATHTTPVFGPKIPPIEDLKENPLLQKPKLIEFLERPKEQILLGQSSPFAQSEPDVSSREKNKKIQHGNRTSTIENRPNQYQPPANSIFTPPSPSISSQYEIPQNLIARRNTKPSSPIIQQPQKQIKQDKKDSNSYTNLQQSRDIILSKKHQSGDENKLYKYVELMLGFAVMKNIQEEEKNLQKVKMIKIFQKEHVNLLLNDFSNFICRKLRMKASSFQIILKQLKEMLSAQSIIDRISKEGQQSLLQTGFYEADKGEYKFIENQDSNMLLGFFVQEYELHIARILQKLSTRKLIKKMPVLFLNKLLLLEIRALYEKQTPLKKEFDTKVALLLSQQLQKWIKNFDMEKIISFEQFSQMITLIESIPMGRTGVLIQKIVLSLLRRDSKRQLSNKIQLTRSQIFMPFRRTDYVFTDEYAKMINGPQWIDWMDLYLRDRDNFEPFEVINITKSIQTFNREESNIELQKKKYIKEFIKKIRQYPVSYYTILSQFIDMSDPYIIPTFIKQFFTSRDALIRELGPFLKQIQFYPNTYFQEDALPEIKAKTLFYLSIIKKNVEMGMKFEQIFFDHEPFIDDEGERCDRVCHTVLDIIGYFSGILFDEDILVAGLECISALLVNEKSKLSMGLAMSINKPAVNFADYVISKKCADKLSEFLIKIFNTKEFYEYVRSPDMSIESSRIYPFRYNLKKYLIMTSKLIAVVPTYWFSEFLKITTRQNFNPKLIYTILSKLRIIPQAGELSPDRPILLETIVNACNSAKFQQQLRQIFASEISFSAQNHLILKNKILSKEDHPHFLITPQHENQTQTVFYSLKILKLLFQLQKIANYSRKIAPSHFISRFLSSLRCLSIVNRSFNLGVQAIPNLSNYQKNRHRFAINKISPVIGLVALLAYSRQIKNHSAQFANISAWNYTQLSTNSFEKLRSQLEKQKDLIDYQIINDLLTQPQSRYLRSDDRISSLAYQCLTYFLQQSTEVSLESILHTLVQIQKEAPVVSGWNRKILDTIVSALQSQNLSLGVSAAKFLVTLKKNRLNRNFSNQIFAEFSRKSSLTYQETAFSRYIAEFYALSFQYNDVPKLSIVPLLDCINGWQISKIQNTIISYQQTLFPVEFCLNEFQRSLKEKEITQIADYLQMLRNLMKTVLRMFYGKNKEFAKNLRVLVEHISQMRLLELVSAELCEQYSMGDAKQELRNQDSMTDEQINKYESEVLTERPQLGLPLRCFGKNPLNEFIVFRGTSRQQVLQQQKQNVFNFIQQGIDQFSRELNEFLKVFLSFDKTFYANHPISISQFDDSYREILCQLHCGHLEISCDVFFGETLQASVDLVLGLMNSCLKKVRKIRKSKLSIDLTSSYLMIDQLLNWLYSNSKKISQITFPTKFKFCYEIQRILEECFTWLGQPIQHQVPAKLLLSLINIGNQSINYNKKSLIKQTVYQTLISPHTTPEIKQYLIPILLIFPPDKSEGHLVKVLIKMWMEEEKNQYFYNLSRLMLDMSEHFYLEMCEANFLTKSTRVTKILQSSDGSYSNGLRTAQSISWIWILKIVTNLITSLNNQVHFTKIHYQINYFFKQSKARILQLLNEPRNQLSTSTSNLNTQIQTKNKPTVLHISLAFLDELEATLQFVLSLFRCNMWRLHHRQSFEELFYVLMHRTIFMFVASEDLILGVKTTKLYRPISSVEKLLWEIDNKSGLQEYDGIIADGEMQIQEDFTIPTNYKQKGPKIFFLVMSIRFMDCSKVWMSACSVAMQYSHFTRECFRRSFSLGQSKSHTSIKYSLTYWDHISQVLVSILQQDILRLKKVNAYQQLTKSLGLIKDCFKSAQLFTEMGYLTTLIQIPETQNKLIESLSINLFLCIQMCSYHFLCQKYFKNLTGAIQQGGLSTLKRRVFQKINHAKIILNGATENQNVELGEQLFESIVI